MNGKLKALGLAFFAVFAFGAIAAQAQAAAFHSEKEKTIITATSEEGAAGEQIFEVIPESGLKVICKHADFAGTQVGTGSGSNWTSETITVHPRYYGETGKPESDCSFLGDPAGVNTTKCHYTLNANTTTGNPTGGEHAKVVLSECTEGGIVITDTTTGIKVTVPNQTVADAVRYTNTEGATGSARDVTIKATAHAIKWTCAPKAACLAGIGANSGENATYSGAITSKGFEDLESTQTTPENNVYAKEGAQVGTWKE
jgi:hypothetical protein